MQAELDRRVKEEEEERARDEEEAKEKSVRNFELLQMGLEIRNRREKEANPRAIFGMGPPKVVGRKNGKIILEEVVERAENEKLPEEGDEGKRGTKRKFELDEEELMRLAREERQKAKIILDNEKVLSLRFASYTMSPIGYTNNHNHSPQLRSKNFPLSGFLVSHPLLPPPIFPAKH